MILPSHISRKKYLSSFKNQHKEKLQEARLKKRISKAENLYMNMHQSTQESLRAIYDHKNKSIYNEKYSTKKYFQFVLNVISQLGGYNNNI